MKLAFLGAAQNVTGSKYLIEANGSRLLVDCGLYQEREYRNRNWEPFPVSPDSIDAVLLTHAHLDHCGYLPKLFHDGFKGEIYCTAATSEIAEIVLLDSAHIQEEDVEFKRNRHQREGRKGPHPLIPLYTQDDAKGCISLLTSVDYDKPVNVGKGIEASFHDAGHILGSSMIRLRVTQDGESRTILFSGDVGRWNKPILLDPTLFENADYVLVESTYGDRLHPDNEDISKLLADVINTTHRAGGNICIPSFAVERAQEVLYHLNKLLIANRIPHLMVFIDSPMAINVTRVFQKHTELYDEEMMALMRRDESPFDFPGLKMTKTVNESKAINHIKGTVIIIAGSGMCTAGRIKHHLVQNISRPESTVLFVGYQARDTLGRHILDGAKDVRILGQRHRVRAKIEAIQGFSAHADRDELFKWLSALKNPPRQLFITHGESDAAERFATFMREKTDWHVSIPNYCDEVNLV
ncbi:MBL fold metallo-hydrolase [candidate division KSB1 bacterium]|nr:MBL fold metallo-hydrolase [candidate division KSB1 bacterium]